MKVSSGIKCSVTSVNIWFQCFLFSGSSGGSGDGQVVGLVQCVSCTGNV